MVNPSNVELEAAKFLHKLIQESTDEPMKLLTKLYVVLQHMKCSGKEHSMPYQVISRATETLIKTHGLDISASMSSLLPLAARPQVGESRSLQVAGSSKRKGVTKDPKASLTTNEMSKPDSYTSGMLHVGPTSTGHDIYQGSPSNVTVGLRPSEGDRIDRDCFKHLHLVCSGDRWPFAKSKPKSISSHGYFQPEYIDDDAGGQEPMEERPVPDLATQEPPYHPSPGIDIPSSSTYIAPSPSCMPPNPSLLLLFYKLDHVSHQLADMKSHLNDLENRQRRIEFAHEFRQEEERRTKSRHD